MTSKFLLSIGAVLGAFLVLDGLWLGFIASTFYRARIGHLMSPTVVWWAAVLFYVLYAVGLTVLVIQPGSSVGGVFVMGALFGLVAYGTYDLTNLSVMRQWPVSLTVIDMLWGALLTGLASIAGYLASR
jgi:uncharacterized membrane protein